jgi:2-C-methyl-D-erythritol 4-phosphate cytidylyltransferase
LQQALGDRFGGLCIDEAGGGRVKVVDGDRRLLKVTTADDLALVQSWL